MAALSSDPQTTNAPGIDTVSTTERFRSSSTHEIELVSNWLESLPPDRATTTQASVAAAVQLVQTQAQNQTDDMSAANTTTTTWMDIDGDPPTNRPPRRRGPLIVPLQNSVTDSMHELVGPDGIILEEVTQTAQPLEAAEQLQVINDAVRARSGDGDGEGAGTNSPSWTGPNGNGNGSSRMMLDTSSSVPEMFNIPELSTDRGTEFGGSDGMAMSCGTGSQIGGGRISQGHASPYYAQSPGDSQRSNNNANNSNNNNINNNNNNNNNGGGSVGSTTNPRHARSNSHGYPRQSLAVSSSAPVTIHQPPPGGVAQSRLIQQLQSSRRGVNSPGGGGRGGGGLHTRTLSQGSFGSPASPASPIRENSPAPVAAAAATGSVAGGSQENVPVATTVTSPQRRGRRKRAGSSMDNSNNNYVMEEEEEYADDSVTPSKRRRMSSQGPEAIDTILASSSVNGASVLKVSIRASGRISEMAEDQVKNLAPRVYKAWKQLQ